VIYLASPYTHSDAAVRAARAKSAADAVAAYLQRGPVVFSPIVYGHVMRNALGNAWEFWKDIDFHFLHQSREFWILMLPGWEESKGIAEELLEARRLLLPIRRINPVALHAGEYEPGARAECREYRNRIGKH
jgi:hypothetical protein